MSWARNSSSKMSRAPSSGAHLEVPPRRVWNLSSLWCSRLPQAEGLNHSSRVATPSERHLPNSISPCRGKPNTTRQPWFALSGRRHFSLPVRGRCHSATMEAAFQAGGTAKMRPALHSWRKTELPDPGIQAKNRHYRFPRQASSMNIPIFAISSRMVCGLRTNEAGRVRFGGTDWAAREP